MVKAIVADLSNAADENVIGRPAPLAGAVAERLRHAQAERQWREFFAVNVRSAMFALGYSEEEVAEVVGTVRVEFDGETVGCSFSAPPRVMAYFDAVRAGDIERADLILHAREG